MAIDVFNYLDYRKYLHDVYHDYKAKDAKFSFRYFSRQAGFKSSSVLKMAISGTRNLTAASAVKCAKALKLKGKELEYFESLVQFNQAKTDKEKELVSIGSSLKICLVAEGEADIYPRLGPTMEWDTGAAHVVANESGVVLKKYKDNEYLQHKYNKENLLNQYFVVGKI